MDTECRIAMIISVGGSPQPIIKAISHYKPSFISFLASQQSVDQVVEIKKQVKDKDGIEFQSEITIVEDINDLLHCFEKSEEAVSRVLNRNYAGEDVIVDYTGGTKNMSVALALAAINNGFVFSYVGGSERTKDGLGVVVDGKEEIYKNINPWDFLGLEERKIISLLFNTYQFIAAREVADRLINKITHLKPIFQKLLFVIDGFYMWDMFRHKDAMERFKRARLDELVFCDDPAIAKFARDVTNTVKKLEEIIEKSSGGKRLCEELIYDLFSNAERRFKEGKIDDAILRLYRIVEMTAQLRLKEKYDIDTSDVKPEQIPEPLKDEYIRAYKSDRDGKIKIPLEASYRLLEALGDDLGRLFMEKKKQFLKIQSSRNYSYLAHGFKSSAQRTYESLKEFLLELGLLSEDKIISFPKIEYTFKKDKPGNTNQRSSP